MQVNENQQNSQSKFKQAQLSLGLRKQYFDAKFVYSQQQVPNPKAFLIPFFKQMPSQLHGFTYGDIQYIHAFACELIHESAKCLNLPVCTSILAQLLFHFFYARKSFLQFDIRDIMIGCIYLACKSEQTLRKSYQITLAFDYILKAYEGDKKVQPMQIGSVQYEQIKNKVIREAQLNILFQLGFQIYKLYDIPHRYMGNLLSIFDKHPKYAQICRVSWKRLNDCYRTTACLYYPHNIIAASAIYMSMRQLQVNFPQIPWWTLMETYQQAILNIQILVLNLETNKQKITFSQIASKINSVGEKLDLINVFPVNYYRKIMLQKKGLCRVHKNQEEENKFQIKKEGTKWAEQPNDKKQKVSDRKIYKISAQLDQNQQAKTQKNIQTKIINQPKKPKIDSKNLLANITQSLQKHEAALTKKNQQQILEQNMIDESKTHKNNNKQQSSQSNSQQQQLKAIAQLRKKIKINKQTNKNGDCKQ